MATKGYSPQDLMMVQDRINSDPQALAAFLESPGGYLEKSGIEVSDEYRKDLEESMREMQIGPRSFDSLASMSKRKMGIMISIRITF